MKKMMLVGRSGCGKTTLVQVVNRREKVYAKTQALEFHINMIDTPGEYIENRLFYKALIVTSAECDIIALVQACTDEDCVFPPGFAGIFPKPVIGIITKIDSKAGDVSNTIKCLEMSGAQVVYATSSVTGKGIEELRKLLE
ncbi:MAG: EutP/PduV family microcompartment system protein [Clostridiaceae bacterium]|jgi:ethanolamine utilization protein EutP|nr:EutP/PduV family microcompartment system protein [Clostridiaceae bacterium]